MKKTPFVNNKLLNWLLIIFSIIFSILLCEIFVRIFIPQITYKGKIDYWDPIFFDLKANYHGEFACMDYKYSFSTDNLRMRITKNFSTQGKSKSILIIGDSFAFGMGVNDTETLASVISDSLHSWKIQAHVFNGAVPAYTCAEEVCKYERMQPIIVPDLIVLVTCFNDFAATTMPCDSMLIENYYGKSCIKKTIWSSIYPVVRDFALGNSQLAVLFAVRYNQIFISLKIRDAFRGVMAAYEPGIYRDYKAQTEHVRIMLNRIFAETKNSGIPLIFTYVPGLLEVDDALYKTAKKRSDSLNRDLPHNHIVGSAKMAGFEHIIDPLEGGKQMLQGKYFPHEMHLNKSGHAYFGSLIADKIRNLLCNESSTQFTGQCSGDSREIFRK
jgi:hypothetical protein